MNDIRVTYSGLIAFSVSIIGVITGLFFVILVTRNLTPEEFGLWTLIGSLISYILVIDPIITYWSTRQIARGDEIGKTAIATSGMFSIGGIIIYLGIAFFLAFTTDVDLSVLIFSSILIPLMFTTNVLTSICMGFKPHAVSYGLLGFETSKIPFGFLLVGFLEYGIIGAILATIISSLFRIIILSIYARGKIIDSIKISVIKFWLKFSWLSMYLGGAGLIYKLDVLIFSLLTSSYVGLAYWGVSQTSSKFIGFSSQLSTGLYPKLLSGGKKEIAEENIKRTLYFSLPLLAFSILFAKPSLHILNPLYIDAVYVVIFISIRTFLDVFRALFFSVLSAYETVDLDKQASFKEYVKSKLFFIPTLLYILSGIYVVFLTVFLLFFRTPDMNDIFITSIWAIIALLSVAPFTIYGYISIRKEYCILLPHIEIIKYSSVTLFTSIIVYYLLENLIIYTPSIYQFIPQLIPIMILGVGLYFGLTFLVDKSTRNLFKLIFKEIKSFLKTSITSNKN
jgi:hypothetical protein